MQGRGAPGKGGLRGNTIALPQAKLELLKAHELPVPPEAAAGRSALRGLNPVAYNAPCRLRDAYRAAAKRNGRSTRPKPAGRAAYALPRLAIAHPRIARDQMVEPRLPAGKDTNE